MGNGERDGALLQSAVSFDLVLYNILYIDEKMLLVRRKLTFIRLRSQYHSKCIQIEHSPTRSIVEQSEP